MAGKLVEKLIARGLIRKESQERLIKKIASGEMKSEDWRLEIELAKGGEDAK
jgi:hypothetical protein